MTIPMSAPTAHSSRPAGSATANLAGSGLQRRVWSRRAATWDHDRLPGLHQVVDAVLEQAHPGPSTVAVDLGCGSGQVTVPLSHLVSEVKAVDVSDAMLDLLERRCAEEGVANVTTVRAALEDFDLPEASVDLVVSNYALHHLADPEKASLVARAVRWLRPGGRLVIGDMMFGRGSEPRDRRIIAAKVKALARRGPGGWWRIAKNSARFLIRAQEKPISMGAWEQLLSDAGLRAVRTAPVVAEAAVATGERPAA